jgi:hypothetical protein
LKRLKKLGINKTDPDALTPDEQKAFARLNINVNTITWPRGELFFYCLFYFTSAQHQILKMTLSLDEAVMAKFKVPFKCFLEETEVNHGKKL